MAADDRRATEALPLRRRVTIDALRRAHRESLGRRGSRVAGDVLALAAGGARFEAERRLHRRLGEAGVGGWLADVSIVLPGYGEAVLDLAFRRDRRRQNALVLGGWTVVRVTWHDLVDDPDRVVAWIRAALDTEIAARGEPPMWP